MGRRNRPVYRVVATDSRAKRDGRFLEALGMWDPIPDREGKKNLRLHFDRVRYWIGVGAQPSDRVAKILGKSGMLPDLPVRSYMVKPEPVAAE